MENRLLSEQEICKICGSGCEGPIAVNCDWRDDSYGECQELLIAQDAKTTAALIALIEQADVLHSGSNRVSEWWQSLKQSLNKETENGTDACPIQQIIDVQKKQRDSDINYYETVIIPQKIKEAERKLIEKIERYGKCGNGDIDYPLVEWNKLKQSRGIE